MPDIERYMVVGCLYTYLRLYSTVMKAHGLDESQMITMFPLSLSGADSRLTSQPDLLIKNIYKTYDLILA